MSEQADPGDGRDPRVADLVSAVAFSAVGRTLARELEPLGIPVLVLKGPPLQRRLFGTDTAYRSADVDLLVHRRDARTVRRFLVRRGWVFSPENGLLWRVDRAAALAKDGVVVDLHWGLHAGTLSARRLAPLERAVWNGAVRSPEGWFEPRLEPLVVYLAVHAAGRRYERAGTLRALRAACDLAGEWSEVEAVARRAGVSNIVSHAVAVSRGEQAGPPPGVDDPWGRARQRLVSLLREQLVPAKLRPMARRIGIGPRRRS